MKALIQTQKILFFSNSSFFTTMKSKLSLKTLTTFFFLVLSVQFGFSSTFHGIIIYDHKAGNVGSVKDKELMETEFTAIAEATGMTLNLKVFSSNSTDVNKQTIMSYINSLTVDDDGVIFVYYTGHSQNSQQDEFPIIPIIQHNEHITQGDLHNLIKSKNARLTISAVDACNHAMPETVYKARNNPLKTIYEALFLKSSGDVKVCSSYNTASWGNPDDGGAFTSSFLNAIRSFESAKDAKWPNLLEKTKQKTSAVAQRIYDEVQIPHYECNTTFDDGGEGGDARICANINCYKLTPNHNEHFCSKHKSNN